MTISTTTTDPQPGGPINRPVTRVAAVMFPLDRAEAASIQQRLGPSWLVAEGRDCQNPDVVIVRACSLQTIAALRHRFPGAGTIAIEPAPVTRGASDRPRSAGADDRLFEVEAGASLLGGHPSRPCRHRSTRWRHRRRGRS